MVKKKQRTYGTQMLFAALVVGFLIGWAFAGSNQPTLVGENRPNNSPEPFRDSGSAPVGDVSLTVDGDQDTYITTTSGNRLVEYRLPESNGNQKRIVTLVYSQTEPNPPFGAATVQLCYSTETTGFGCYENSREWLGPGQEDSAGPFVKTFALPADATTVGFNMVTPGGVEGSKVHEVYLVG